METKTVLVTGIGGNVGQGIIRNLRASQYPLRILGTNTAEWSAGNHLVDEFYKVPFAFDEGYIPLIIDVVKNEKIDLIIPSTDFEIYYLSKSHLDIPCKIACSDSDAAFIYLDKYLTWTEHQKLSIPFAESYLPTAYSGQFNRAIAKPRKGRGSRGLMKDVLKVDGLNDDEYMIQEMISGQEITTAVYCKYSDREILGLITMERTLDNGATNYCKVIDEYDSELLKIAEKMVANFGLKGSFNIQSIVNHNRVIYPFEVNCRISGTNSIRSGFGFNDVVYTVEELLFNKVPEQPKISKGVAYRYLADIIYPVSDGLKGNNDDAFILN